MRSWGMVMQRDSSSEPQSPCRRHCCLDDQDTCVGCYRTLSEICGWSEYSDSEKRAVLKRVEARRRQRAPANHQD